MRWTHLAIITTLSVVTNAHAATFTVTSVNASGAGSLAEAINSANATTATDTIAFAITPAGGQKILTPPTTGYPEITRPIIIDGYTQSGSTPNSANLGSNAVLNVLISRNTLGNPKDPSPILFRFSGTSSGSVIRGLHFVQFDPLALAFINSTENDITIVGNWFGFAANGIADGGNAPDTAILVGSTGADNVIGGLTPADRNMFGHLPSAILTSAAGTVVHNNLFGVGKNNTTSAPIADVAIQLSGIFGDVGGYATNEANFFHNIEGDAVVITGANATGNSIQANRFNNIERLAIDLVGPNDLPNGVTPNDIVDSDSGPNGLINHPVLSNLVRTGTSVTFDVTISTQNSGNTDLFLEFYATDTGAPVGECIGQRFVSSEQIDSANFTFSKTLNGIASSEKLCALVTGLQTADTSKFSNALNDDAIFSNSFEQQTLFSAIRVEVDF